MNGAIIHDQIRSLIRWLSEHSQGMGGPWLLPEEAWGEVIDQLHAMLILTERCGCEVCQRSYALAIDQLQWMQSCCEFARLDQDLADLE